MRFRIKPRPPRPESSSHAAAGRGTEKTAREDSRHRQTEAVAAPKKRSTAIARLDQQIEELERLLREGTLSPVVVGPSLEKAHSERALLEAVDTKADDRSLDKVVRMLPRIADTYRRRVRALLDGTADSRTVNATRSALLELFGGPVRLIPAENRDHLLAEVALNRTALLQAAGGHRVSSGSGGPLPIRAIPLERIHIAAAPSA